VSHITRVIPDPHPIDRRRAAALIEAMTHVPVLVLGDVMLDQFIVGRVNRISPEAPVPVVVHERDAHRAGGAANVALNARALGATVTLVGPVGADPGAETLRELLSASAVSSTSLITDETRRTTTKVRIVTTRNQQVARVDYETDAPLAQGIEDALIAQVEHHAPRARVIIVSDYLKGAVTRRVMAAVVASGQAHGVPVLVDPKIPHLDFYSGASLVTPNHVEAEGATHQRIRTDDDARRAAEMLRHRARCDGVLITRGEQGMWLSWNGIEGNLPAMAREVADVTGAGDTVIATLALAHATGAGPLEAAQLATAAAGICVGKFGPVAVSGAEIVAGMSE
jgi:D-beta-D-heptose 7-phosphate kinase/D-beta-D-heptose 1-phosphate adenosyltransferase